MIVIATIFILLIAGKYTFYTYSVLKEYIISNK